MPAGVADRKRPPVGLVVFAVLFAAAALIPVGYVIQAAFAMGWQQLADLVFRPRVGELLTNTVLLVVLGVPCAVVLGVGGAWLVERTTLPARRLFAVLLVMPLTIPAFVASYGWASAIPSINGLGGGLLVATLAYYPLVYLPALASLRGLDPALEESARSLGMNGWQVFLRVILPQLRLAMLGGGLVVALHLLAEYGAFAFLRFETFTTAIVVAYQAGFAGPNAAALGVVLAMLCFVVLVIEAAARGRLRYSRVGSGTQLPAPRVELGRAAPFVVGALLVLATAAVAVPLANVGRWLFATDAADWQPLLNATWQTVVLSVGGAVAALVVALPIAWIAARYPGRTARTLEGAYYVASSLPAIIVALALVTFTLRVVPAMYQTVATVIAAYVLIFLPRALVSVRAGVAQIPEGFEEAARSLGVSPFMAKLRVTAPLLLPSLAAGAALVALGAANELTATLLLAPTGTRTVATGFWAAASAIDYAAAAPYALTLVLLSVPAVALMFAQVKARRSR
ncbi:ABC transporter permease [Agromyces cerinus]|uniref:Iron(III) transport system permease protein n=1 Tax=Agromyces cerinus subsp. cerinus TaxID=232089 RepID=A0A1N6HK01_9MICO|nr:iron ABC transporter permease [Agromyces cerinus]SIO20019.1 iron(III) transport system permease protein [Agromyces cerinus subsp. cerinus]